MYCTVFEFETGPLQVIICNKYTQTLYTIAPSHLSHAVSGTFFAIKSNIKYFIAISWAFLAQLLTKQEIMVINIRIHLCTFINFYEKTMWIIFLCMYVHCTSVYEENKNWELKAGVYSTFLSNSSAIGYLIHNKTA